MLSEHMLIVEGLPQLENIHSAHSIIALTSTCNTVMCLTSEHAISVWIPLSYAPAPNLVSRLEVSCPPYL